MINALDRSKFEVIELTPSTGVEKGLKLYSIVEKGGHWKVLHRDGTIHQNNGCLENNGRYVGAMGCWNTRESAEEFLRKWQEEVKPIQPRHGDVFIDPYGIKMLVVFAKDGLVNRVVAMDTSGMVQWGYTIAVSNIGLYHKDFIYKPLYNAFDQLNRIEPSI